MGEICCDLAGAEAGNRPVSIWNVTLFSSRELSEILTWIFIAFAASPIASVTVVFIAADQLELSVHDHLGRIDAPAAKLCRVGTLPAR